MVLRHLTGVTKILPDTLLPPGPSPSVLMENPLPLKRSCFSQASQQEQMDVFSRTGK